MGRRQIRWERYPLKPDEMIRDACALTHRSLSAGEWKRFLGGEARRETCAASSRVPLGR